jgi:hypothetical protein
MLQRMVALETLNLAYNRITLDCASEVRLMPPYADLSNANSKSHSVNQMQ